MASRSFSSDPELRSLKPESARYDARDLKTRGMIVRVSQKGQQPGQGGAKTFCLVARLPGASSPSRIPLGTYPEISLKDARTKAEEWRTLIKKGQDPRERPAAPTEDQNTFGAVAEEFIRRHMAGQRRGDKGAKEIRRELLPHWKDRPIGEITRTDVVGLIERIVDRPAPAQAHITLGHIRSVFNWAIDRGQYGLTTSPTDRMKPGRIIGKKVPRQRTLNEDEIFALWRAASRLGYPNGPFVKLLMMTGLRLAEVAEARWAEFPPRLVAMLRQRKPDERIDWSKIDKTLKRWAIGAERFKSEVPRLVPLSDDVLRVLESLPHFAAGDYLFSSTAGEKPVNGFSKLKADIDRRMLRSMKAVARRRRDDPQKVVLPGWVNHDLRRVVRSNLSALRIPDHVAELTIGHTRKGLQAVYDQHRFLDEVGEALDAWAGRLRQIVDPAPAANVVPFKSVTV